MARALLEMVVLSELVTRALPAFPSSCTAEKSILFKICYLMVLIKNSFPFFSFYLDTEVAGEERIHKNGEKPEVLSPLDFQSKR